MAQDDNRQMQHTLTPPSDIAGNAAARDVAAEAWDAGDLKRLRMRKHESQARFWLRFGVTQSSGSRFEMGLQMPPPVAILLKLYADGKLSDADLPV
jgi:hypothetical protein